MRSVCDLSGFSGRPVGGRRMLNNLYSKFLPAFAASVAAAGLLGAATAWAAETPTKSSPPAKIVDQAKRVTPARPTVEPATPRATEGAVEPAAETSPSQPQKLRFQFTFTPWKDVLNWFAKQADLSLDMGAGPPPGTFNYTDSHQYTPTEAIDLLNSDLLTKGYTLVRHNRLLMLINLEDGIPENLVTTVPVNSLDGRGEFEVVRVIFDLDKVKPEDVEGEIKKLLGPQGKIISLGKSRQIAVTETAGRLRAIRAMLARLEGTDGTIGGGLRAIELKFARPEDVPADRPPDAGDPGGQERLVRRLDPHRLGGRRGAAVRQRPAGKGRPRRRHHQGARCAHPRHEYGQPAGRHAADRGLPGSQRRRRGGALGPESDFGWSARRAADGRSEDQQRGRLGPAAATSDDSRHLGPIGARGATGGGDPSRPGSIPTPC